MVVLQCYTFFLCVCVFSFPTSHEYFSLLEAVSRILKLFSRFLKVLGVSKDNPRKRNNQIKNICGTSFLSEYSVSES